MIGELLDAGAPVNQQAPSHGMTPLMVAAWHRRPAAVRRLLRDRMINLNLRNVLGLTALEVVGLGSAGASDAGRGVDEQIRAAIAEARQRQEALVDSQQLIAEALKAEPDLQRVVDLLSEGADVDETAPNTCSGHDGHTPLHIAARDGHAALARLLLEVGADQSRQDSYMPAVPAHKAAYFGHADVLRVLCAHPSFAAVANAQGPFNGYTPLHDAVWHGHLEATRVLLSAGVRTDLAGHDGRTPVELAADNGYADLVAVLQRAG